MTALPTTGTERTEPKRTTGCRCGRLWFDEGICINCGHGTPDVEINGLTDLPAAKPKRVVRRRLLVSRRKYPTRRQALAAVLARNPFATPVAIEAFEHRDGQLYPPHKPNTPLDQVGVPVWLVHLDR